jgi:hypothetical protein
MTRWLPLLIVVLALAGGGWLFVRGDREAGDDSAEVAGSAPGARAGVEPSEALLVGRAPAAGGGGSARIGVLSPEDRAIPSDPRATPLAQVELDLPGAAPGGLTGQQLLDALAERFLVRARHADDLTALKAERFEVEGGRRMPLNAAVALLRQKGYFTHGSDGRAVLVVGRLSAEERARAAGGDAPTGMAWQGDVPRPLPGPGEAGSGEKQP